MSKSSFSWRFFIVSCALAAVASCGCKEKQELSQDQYGETLQTLPVVRDLPLSFPISDELEEKECRIRKEVEEGAEQRLYDSQGRSLELNRIKADRAREELQKEREARAAAEAKQKEAEAAEEPVVEEPVAEEPVAEEPVAEEPAVEEPVAEEPAVEEPAAEEPATEGAILEAPVVEEPVVDAPAAE